MEWNALLVPMEGMLLFRFGEHWKVFQGKPQLPSSSMSYLSLNSMNFSIFHYTSCLIYLTGMIINSFDVLIQPHQIFEVIMLAVTESKIQTRNERRRNAESDSQRTRIPQAGFDSSHAAFHGFRSTFRHQSDLDDSSKWVGNFYVGTFIHLFKFKTLFRNIVTYAMRYLWDIYLWDWAYILERSVPMSHKLSINCY